MRAEHPCAGPRATERACRQTIEEIMLARGSMVLRVRRGVLGRADAEDAWSETLLSVLKAYPELSGGADVEAWAGAVAHPVIEVVRPRTGRRGTAPDAAQGPERIGLAEKPVRATRS